MSDYQESKELKDVYLTYNGLNRPALVMGIPILLLLALGLFSLITAFIGIKVFGLVGIIPTGICFLIGLLIRSLTESDPNALKVVSFKLKGVFLKLGSPILRVKG